MNVKWNDLIYEDVVSIILVFLQAYVNLNFVREVINQFLLCMSENWIELSDYLAPGIAGSGPPITWLYLQPTTWLNTPSANHLTEYTLSQSPDWIHLQPTTWLNTPSANHLTEYTLSHSPDWIHLQLITWVHPQPTTCLNTPSANHLTEYTLSHLPDWIHLQPTTWLNTPSANYLTEYTFRQSPEWIHFQPTTWMNTPSDNHLTEYTFSQPPDWIHLQTITWLEYTLSQSERHNWAKDLFIPSVTTMPDQVRHVLFFYPNPKPYV